MTTVTIEIDKIDSAITAMKDLADAIDLQRSAAQTASPVHLPTLSSSGVAKSSAWMRDHLEDLTLRRDVAILLDRDGTGSASFTVAVESNTEIERLLARELASQLGGLDHESELEDYERVLGVLSVWKNDTGIMADVFSELGPDGTVAAFSQIGQAMSYGPVGTDVLDDLAKDLRTGLTSASNDPGFPPSFGRELVRYTVVPLLSQDEYDAFQKEFGGLGMSGANLLTFLMEDTTYDDDFLLAAANQLDEFERLSADGFMDANYWYSHNGHGPLPTNGDRDLWHDDPMAAIMNNFAANPEAGLEFFTGGDDPAGRQQFYFEQRDWRADGYEGVSNAVASIGTNTDLLEGVDARATTDLVSSFFDHIAENEHFNPDDASGASPHVASLMKFYMPAVDNALRNYGTDGEPGSASLSVLGIGEFDPYPVMFTDDLDILMEVSLSTDEGAQRVAEGIGAFQATQINNLAAQLAADPTNDGLQTQLRGALESSAALQGFAEYTIGRVEIEGAADRDAQRQAFIDMVQDAAGLVPLPGASQVGDLGSKLINYGYSEAVSLGHDAAGERFANEEAAARDNAEERAEAGSTRMRMDAFVTLVEAGVIPEDAIPSGWLEDGKLKDPSEFPADRAHVHAQGAENVVMEYAFTTPYDLSGAYRSSFESFYGPASKE